MFAKTRRLLKDNSGVAMIYSLVIGIVVSIFAVMLLVVTYSLFAQSSRQTGQTQCQIMADSYAECLVDELKDKESSVYKYLIEQLNAGNDEIELDLIQDNYTIYTTFKYVGGAVSEDNDLSVDLDDNDPESSEETAPTVTPTPTGGVIPMGRNVKLTATISCNKGGKGGIGEQSYTLTQKYILNME